MQLSSLQAELVTQSEALLVLRVVPEQMNRVISSALASLPVVDLTVEDPPLEEILSDLFHRSARAARPELSSDPRR
jgi:ABC-2 type transport system ATP-binding protein